MTNLIFAVLTTLVTNSTEQLERPMIPGPCPNRMIGCCALHWIPDLSREAERKTVTTSICRVTNAVECVIQNASQGIPAPRTFELGRERISETVESFQLVTTKEWRRQGQPTTTTNWTYGGFVTNSISYGTNVWLTITNKGWFLIHTNQDK